MIYTPRASQPGVYARHTVRRRCVVARAASAEVKEPGSVQGVENEDPTPSNLRKLEDLPSVRGLPLLGMLLTMLDEDFEIATLFEKYNTDAFNIYMGPAGGWQLCIQDAQLLQDACVTHLKNVYPKWPAGVENLVLAQGKSMKNEEIKPWRAATAKILSQGTVMRLQVPLIVSEFTQAVRRLAASGEEVKWFNVSKRLTFSAACRAAMGDVLSRQELDELFPLAKEMGKGVFSVSFGLKEGLPFTDYWRAHQANKQLLAILDARIQAVVQEDRASLDCGKATVLREVLATLEEEGVDTTSDVAATCRRLAKEVIQMMFVGTDTTSYTMSRSMVWLAKHPEWLQALKEEQHRLMAEHGPELDQTVLTKSAVAQAIAQEVLRLTPPVRLLYRRTTKDIVLGDIFVPEGTEIAMSARKAILSTGSGKREFDPDHWLSENRTLCARNDSMANFVFGQGGRNCVGKNLALVETMCLLSILGREVSAIEMSPEEKNRTFFIIGDHPTGLPLTLKPQAT